MSGIKKVKRGELGGYGIWHGVEDEGKIAIYRGGFGKYKDRVVRLRLDGDYFFRGLDVDTGKPLVSGYYNDFTVLEIEISPLNRADFELTSSSPQISETSEKLKSWIPFCCGQPVATFVNQKNGSFSRWCELCFSGDKEMYF